jgi:hypothetical protein
LEKDFLQEELTEERVSVQWQLINNYAEIKNFLNRKMVSIIN